MATSWIPSLRSAYKQNSSSNNGWIALTAAIPISYTSIFLKFKFRYKSQCNFTEHSIRLYYTTTPGLGVADYVDITEENADSWILNSSFMSDIYTVTYTLKNLPGGAGTTYYVRVWLRLFNKSGTKVKYTFKSPAPAPLACNTLEYDRKQPLLLIGTYEDVNDSAIMAWADFTQNITVPSYDVIETDVTEEWTNADYETKKIVTRTKITGKFNMIFSDREEFNRFLDIIRYNREITGCGKVFMQVHVNNKLFYDDEWQDIGVTNLKNETVSDWFYISITSVPWVEPYYGHYDKYSPITVNIEQV